MAGVLTDSDKSKIENAKKKWNEANARGDTAGMEAAHAEAEAVRNSYGYTGGDDGSKFTSISDGSPLGIGNGGKSKNSTSTSYGSYKEDLDRLTEAKRQSQINALKQARQKALDNLDVQEQEIAPAYQNQRNLASANSQQNARSFAEYLANRGLTNSGASAQGEINRQSSLQNTLGNIGTAEANAFRDIANQRTQVENDYVAGLANANSAIDTEYYNNLLNYNEQQRQMVQALKQQSLGQYANDYQAQINSLLSQGYSPNSLEVLQLQALRGQKMNNNYSNAMNNALASIQTGNINYNNAAALGWTVEQAQAYYNNLVAQAQAQAEQQAFENRLAEQESNATVRNKNASTQNYYSQINNRESSGGGNNNYLSQNQVQSQIEKFNTQEDVINYIDNLVNNGMIDEQTWRNLYLLNNLPM